MDINIRPLHDRIIVKTPSGRGKNSGRYYYS